jgi:PucR C-terminal helix-turn-helix domain/GGDEF-like domain
MSQPIRVRRDTAVQVIRATADRLAALVPGVTDRVVADVRAAVPDARRLPPDVHRRLVRQGLETGIETLRGAGERPDLSYAGDIGRQCAELGLPVDVALRTYRVAGRWLWEAVIDIVAATDPEQLAVLPYTATEFWQVIDEQSVVTAEAYQEARWEHLRRSRERTRALLDALLAGQGSDPAVARAAAAALGLPERGRYAVVVARASGDRDPDRENGRATAPRLVWTARPDREVALVELGEASLDDLVSELRATVSAHAGISPVVDRLADLGHACRLAEIALQTCVRADPELARFDQRLAAALVAAHPELGRELARTVDPAGTLTPHDRALLLETFTMWLDCGGSVSRTAARLYCHRNTVNNRLRRLFAASGRTVDRPWDLIEQTLAVLAIRIRDWQR